MTDHISTSDRGTGSNPLRHWYIPLIIGLLFVAVGIGVFFTPLASYLALAIVFGLAFLMAGVMEISYAVSNRRSLQNWGWTLAGGILDLVIGLLLLAHPGITMIILPFFVGFGILFRSIMAIAWSVDLKKADISGWGSAMALGILGVIFAIIVLFNPVLGGLTIVVYTGLAFLSIGVFQIFLAFRLRKQKKILG